MKLAALVSALCLLSVPAFAAETVQRWKINPEESSIRFSGRHAGKEFTGKFKTWKADIAFDPARLAESAVDVTVETGTAETGNALYDGSLRAMEWLNPKEFPTAIFKTSTFRETGEGAYEASGTLTLKGQTQDLVLPFSLKLEGDTATMNGTVTLDRLAFDVGKAADPKAEWVDKDIKVSVDVKASKAP